MDQVPLPFVVDQDKTYADKDSKQVWVSLPASDLEKRQFCIRPSGEQIIKPAIVFRGKENITSDELAKYDKRVDVYFQDKGWMDIKTNKEWTERTLMPGILHTRKESVLFADYLLIPNRERIS